MHEPRYLLYYFVAVIVGCPLGALWFELAMRAKESEYHSFALLPLTIFDSFLVGWFPAILFGALLHYSMQRLGRTGVPEWMLGGALLGWGLFILGAQVAKIDFGLTSFLLLGVRLLRNLSSHSWPAAICGAATAAILRMVAAKWAPVTVPAATS